MTDITFHECPNGATLLCLNIGKEKLCTRGTKKVALIAIVDRSVSMGNNVERIMTGMLPGLMKKHDYDRITIITFDSVVETFVNVDVNFLMKNRWNSRGSTHFEPVFGQLEKTMNEIGADCYHLLTISDGGMDDINGVVKSSTMFQSTICVPGRTIISHAIRYGTGWSVNAADTRGLSSVLQYNTHVPSKLVDLRALDSVDAARSLGHTDIADLFADAPRSSAFASLGASTPIILENPWDTTGKSELKLVSGKHLVWVLGRPSELTINGAVTEIVEGPRMTIDNSESLLGSKVQFWMDRIRILQVMQVTDRVDTIGQYFSNLQSSLVAESVASEVPAQGQQSSKDKIKAYLQKKKRTDKSVLMTISRIANENAVGRLNAQQAADYLRGTTVSANSKGLARRAGMTGDDAIDIDALVRKEICAIIDNVHVLEDLRATPTEIQSFCSLESTLSALFALKEFTLSDLDELSAVELLRFVHIVGIACNGKIGDYPDPMSWRCDDIYPGVYISVADITEHFMVAHSDLMAPGYNKPISTVIPVFDEPRVHHFLRKFAPNVLDLCAGIGMRRMIASVSTTHLYTICGGAFGAITRLCSGDAPKATVDCLSLILPTLTISVGKYFEHLVPYVQRAPLILEGAVKRSFYITNNGATNLLAVLFSAYRDDTVIYEADILRSIYSYETYQMLKKYRKNSSCEVVLALTDDSWDRLLEYALKLSPDMIDVGESFTADLPAPQPDMIMPGDLPKDDNPFFKECKYRFKFLNYIGMLPHILKPMAIEGTLNLETLPKADGTTLMASLGVDGMPIDDFMFYNMIHSIVYHSQQLRMDKDADMMFLPDIDSVEAGLFTIRKERTKYLAQVYADKLRAKRTAETKVLAQELVQSLLATESMYHFCDTIRDGVSRNGQTYTFTNAHSEGVAAFRLALSNEKFPVPNRLLKIATFMIGKDVKSFESLAAMTSDSSLGVVCWNNGNTIRTKLDDFGRFFVVTSNQEAWDKIRDCFRVHTKSHIYRETNVPNRHKHNNDFLSYWALGYKDLADMASKVSEAEMIKYESIHRERKCCGYS